MINIKKGEAMKKSIFYSCILILSVLSNSPLYTAAAEPEPKELFKLMRFMQAYEKAVRVFKQEGRGRLSDGEIQQLAQEMKRRLLAIPEAAIQIGARKRGQKIELDQLDPEIWRRHYIGGARIP